MKGIIIIPARYGSTRLPGKPLAQISGIPMLARVVAIARKAAAGYSDVSVLVATDDSRIKDFCRDLDVPAVMTSVECPTGSDRVREAVAESETDAEFVLNLQGDAPLTPPWILTAMLDAFAEDPQIEVVTPVVRLSWQELDVLRDQKRSTPFSGTTAVVDSCGNAFWFSKNIIPAVRKEVTLRERQDISPVLRHVGIYGFRRDVLERYVTLDQGVYEQLEGLEQLRLLENGISIRTVQVDYCGRPSMSGVDSPEDIGRAEALIARYGELV